MNFANLDFNNLVLLGIAVIGLINTWMTARATAAAKAANATAETSKAIAVETRDIVQKTEANTKSIVSGVKKERDKMADLLDDALLAVKKNGRRSK